MTWRSEHLPALWLLCLLAAAGLGLQAIRRPVSLGMPAAVFPDRIAVARDRINPNTASEASLVRLPGIGPAKARAIVLHRRTHGPFRTCDDLQAVHGIGPILTQRMQPHLTLPSAPPK